MVDKRPHTLTFTWNTTSYSGGKLQTGALGSLTIKCRYVPAKRFLTRNVNGDLVQINYKVFTDLLIEQIPETAKVTIEGKEYGVIQVFNYQNYSCIWL